MNEMSLVEQIAKMKEMRDFLEGFCKMMRTDMDGLQQQVEALRAVGLPTEKADDYLQRFYAPANDKVEEVIGNIYSRHISFLEEKIRILEKILFL